MAELGLARPAANRSPRGVPSAIVNAKRTDPAARRQRRRAPEPTEIVPLARNEVENAALREAIGEERAGVPLAIVNAKRNDRAARRQQRRAPEPTEIVPLARNDLENAALGE